MICSVTVLLTHSVDDGVQVDAVIGRYTEPVRRKKKRSMRAELVTGNGMQSIETGMPEESS